MAKFYGVDSYRSANESDVRRSNSLLANAGSGIMTGQSPMKPQFNAGDISSRGMTP
jgi:hypothetical protein